MHIRDSGNAREKGESCSAFELELHGGGSFDSNGINEYSVKLMIKHG